MDFSERDCTDRFLCSKCKGRCCKQNACYFMPDDFEKIEFHFLSKVIKDKGYISIAKTDKAYGSPLPYWFYYLKIRNLDAKFCDNNPRGRCMLLSEKGCKLSFNERPSGGKALIPDEEGCYSLYREKDILEAWKPHQDVLKKLWDAFFNT